MASIVSVARTSTVTAGHLWWSMSTAAAQIANAFTIESRTIFTTSATVPEKS